MNFNEWILRIERARAESMALRAEVQRPRAEAAQLRLQVEDARFQAKQALLEAEMLLSRVRVLRTSPAWLAPQRPTE